MLGAKELGCRRQACGKPKGCVDGYVFLLEPRAGSRCQGPFEQLGLRSRSEVERVVQRSWCQSEPLIWCFWDQMCFVIQGFVTFRKATWLSVAYALQCLVGCGLHSLFKYIDASVIKCMDTDHYTRCNCTSLSANANDTRRNWRKT